MDYSHEDSLKAWEANAEFWDSAMKLILMSFIG